MITSFSIQPRPNGNKVILKMFFVHFFVFFREDAENLARAQNNNVESKSVSSVKEDRGMYSSLSLHHLYTLLDCLIQAHRFMIGQQGSHDLNTDL